MRTFATLRFACFFHSWIAAMLIGNPLAYHLDWMWVKAATIDNAYFCSCNFSEYYSIDAIYLYQSEEATATTTKTIAMMIQVKMWMNDILRIYQNFSGYKKKYNYFSIFNSICIEIKCMRKGKLYSIVVHTLWTRHLLGSFYCTIENVQSTVYTI